MPKDFVIQGPTLIHPHDVHHAMDEKTHKLFETWKQSPALRQQFQSFSMYLNYCKNEQAHERNTRMENNALDKLMADIPATETMRRALWNTEPGLRTEFMGDFEAFSAYCDAQKAGRVRICNAPCGSVKGGDF